LLLVDVLALLPVVLSDSLLLEELEQKTCQLIGVRPFIGSGPQKSHQGPSVMQRKDRLNASKINRKHPFIFFLLRKTTVISVLGGKAEMLLLKTLFLILSKSKGQKINLLILLSANV